MVFFNAIATENNFTVNITHVKNVNINQQTILCVIEYSDIKRPCMIAKIINDYYLTTLAKGVLGQYSN